MATATMDDLQTLLQRLADMRREVCAVQAATGRGTPLFSALDALMAGCDDFLNVVEDEADFGPIVPPLAA